MTSGSNEVEAGMNAEVTLLRTLWLLLLPHVRFVLVIDKVDNGSPGVTVVDVVAEPGRIDHRKLDLERFLFKFSLDFLCPRNQPDSRFNTFKDKNRTWFYWLALYIRLIHPFHKKSEYPCVVW